MPAYASYPQTTGPRTTPTVMKTGRQVITAPGTYSGWHVTAGNIDIQCPSGTVILEDFIVDARGTTAAGPIWVRGGFAAKVEVRYGTVIGAANQGSTGVNMLTPYGWAHHLDISNTEDGFRCGHNTLIEYNYVHDLFMSPLSHNDGLQLQGTEQDVEIRYNRIDGRLKGQTSAILIKCDTGDIARINVHHNYLGGGAYTVYVYDANAFHTTAVQLDNNVFMRNTALYAQLATLPNPSPASQISSKTGNRWDDGTLIWG